jgi:hypothetical protein
VASFQFIGRMPLNPLVIRHSTRVLVSNTHQLGTCSGENIFPSGLTSGMILVTRILCCPSEPCALTAIEPVRIVKFAPISDAANASPIRSNISLAEPGLFN